MVWFFIFRLGLHCYFDRLRGGKMKRLKKQIIDILGKNDYRFLSVEKHGEDYIAELETWSPAGEDVVIDIWFDGTNKGFIDSFRQYSLEFDPDEHAEMWVEFRGKRGVPHGIRDLIDDADAIQESLMAVSNALDMIEL